MKAVKAYAPKEYRLENVPVPKPGPGEAVMKTAACGICGSDLHCFRGAPSYWGDADTPSWVKPPFTPGHEFSGVP